MERFSNEHCLTGWIELGETSFPAQVLIRFDRDVVQALLTFTPGEAPARLDGAGSVLGEALVNLLMALDDKSATLRFEHAVSARGRSHAWIREEIRLKRPHLEDVEYRYSYDPGEAGHQNDGRPPRVSSRWDEFTQVALYDLVSGGIQLECCGTCRFAELPVYGGVDDRHGLFCFRENPAGLNALAQETDYSVWATLSHPDTDAFHRCERHAYREKSI